MRWKRICVNLSTNSQIARCNGVVAVVDVETQRITFANRVSDSRVVFLLVVNYQVIEMIIELIRQMLDRIRETNNSCILVRCLEIECKMLFQVIIEGIGVFSIRRIADLYRVFVSVDRIHREM